MPTYGGGMEIFMKICLYGASSDDIKQIYIDTVFEFGKQIAQKGHTLIFGGGAHGLMGAAARGVRLQNGTVTGISPRFFDINDILFKDCTEFIYTETMRERKQLLEEYSDAFVVSPGGIGTYEEFFEILTLKQLAKHNKPIVIFNIDGYYDSMIKLLQATVDQGFMKKECMEIFKVLSDPSEVIEYIENYNEKEIDIQHLKNI